MVEREPDPAARLSLALALIRLDETHDTALDVLMRLSIEESGMAGLQAAVELARGDDATALRRVREDRRDDDVLIRSVAFAALAGAFGHPDDALEGLEDPAWRVRVRTAGAIMSRALHDD
jgi:HEAT repeat protein